MWGLFEENFTFEEWKPILQTPLEVALILSLPTGDE